MGTTHFRTTQRSVMLRISAATLLLVLGLFGSIDARPNMDPDAFLTKFGYLDRSNARAARDPRDRKNAFRRFQRMVGLKETGEPDTETLWKMAQPRCGMPDEVPVGSGVSANALTDPSRNPMNYYVPGFKWRKNDLSWRVVNYSPDLYWGTQRDNFREAFAKWSKVTPLNFRQVSTTDQDIEMKFASGDHGDGSKNAFDGPGGVLAHAYYPTVGDTHFDEDETWTANTHSGTNLLNVATHELGHALGLGHSNVANSVMAPYYQGYDPNFELKNDDIKAIQSLYGKRQSTATTTKKPTTTTTRGTTSTSPRQGGITTPTPATTTKKPTTKIPDPCKMKIDAVYQAPDQRIYIFRQGYVWKVDDSGLVSGFPKRTQKLFENAPSSIGAAVYSTRTHYTYFFKRNRVFKYYGVRRLIKKTITSKGYPNNPQAAHIGRDGRIYLFKGAYYWVFDESTLDIVDPSPRPISSMWPGVPKNIEAAVRYRDGNIYFFKGRKYRKFSERLRKVVSGYPKRMAPAWFGSLCGGKARAPRLQEN